MDFSRKTPLGLDIGSRTIKGVQLKTKGKRVLLHSCLYQDLALSHEAYPEGVDVSETLKAEVELQGVTNARFASGISDREVFHLMLELPPLKGHELRTAVGHEIAENTGIAVNELAFDFTQMPTPAGERHRISAYGARREAIEKTVSLGVGARLRPDAVESDILALIAMLEFNDYIEPAKVQVVFDLGESHLTAGLILNGSLATTQWLETGWGKINQALVEKLNLSYGDAEARKRRYDFSSSDTASAATEQVIDEAYATIFSGVKRSLERFKGHSPEAPEIHQIILIGGGSQTANIEKVFEMFFRTPTVIANPFRNIDLYAGLSVASATREVGAWAAYMGVAVGMALRNIPRAKVVA